MLQLAEVSVARRIRSGAIAVAATRIQKLVALLVAVLIAFTGAALTTPAVGAATAAESAAAPAVSERSTSVKTAKKAKKVKKVKKACPKVSKRKLSILKASKTKKAKAKLRAIKRCKAKSPAEKLVDTAKAADAANASKEQASAGAGSPTVFGLSANGDAAVTAAEDILGVQAGVLGVFTDWKNSFPFWASQDAARRGAALLISWEPQDSEASDRINQPAYQLDAITRGDYDDYIRQFAVDAASTDRPVIVRWAAEMNGDWHPWSTGLNGNGPGDYAAAYRHVVDTARAAGGTNIKWMFNPIVSYPGSYPLASLYPGTSYVDWAGLDGYNFGDVHAWGWESFDTVYARGLAEIKQVAPGKPLAVAEIGCNPNTPDKKAAWVTDAMHKLRLAGAKMVVWFEHNKETDWRLSSNATVAAAARSAITAPGWIGGGDWNAVKTALNL